MRKLTRPIDLIQMKSFDAGRVQVEMKPFKLVTVRLER